MNDLENLYIDALQLSTHGETDKAQKVIDKILKINPNYGKAHYLLGLMSLEYDDLEMAKEHANIAIKDDPCNPLGYYLYCDILIAEQNLNAIKTITEGLVNLKIIDKGFIYHKLACAYEINRQYVNAIETLYKSKEHGSSISWGSFVEDEILRIRRKLQAA